MNKKPIHPTIWNLRIYSFSLADVLDRQSSSPNMVQSLFSAVFFCCQSRSTVTTRLPVLFSLSMRGSQLGELPDWAPPQWLKEEAFVTLSSAPEPGSQPVSEAWGGVEVRWVSPCRAGEFTWGSTRLAVRRWAAAGTGPARWGGCGGWGMWRLLRKKERQSRGSGNTVNKEAGRGGQGQWHKHLLQMLGCIHVFEPCEYWISW